jgi:hypothetical protein
MAIYDYSEGRHCPSHDCGGGTSRDKVVIVIGEVICLLARRLRSRPERTTEGTLMGL